MLYNKISNYKSCNSKSTRTFRGLLSLSCAMVVLSGCQTDDDVYVDAPVDSLYRTAKSYLNEKEYTRAAKAFANVESQHPYSNWALRAQLMSSYSYYRAKKYDDAIDGFQTFIQLHPGHTDVVYAYYMVGLCYYEQVPIVQRDQQAAQRAEDAFLEVVNRYKTSIYSKDAQFKIDFLKDHMAAKEMDIGRYYQKQGSLVGALNRFKNVVENFKTTSQIPEALFRLVECYVSLGLFDDAKAAAAVLGYNYKDSQWYRDAYDLLKLPLPITVPAKNGEELKVAIDDSLEKQKIDLSDLTKTDVLNDSDILPGPSGVNARDQLPRPSSNSEKELLKQGKKENLEQTKNK